MGVQRHLCLSFFGVVAFTALFVAALGRGIVDIAQGEAMSTARRGHLHHQRGEHGERGVALSRRQLIGPGSSPPTCRFRCGWCFPCVPVHVAIQPRVSQPLDYYPETWRCKCGSKLYMP